MEPIKEITSSTVVLSQADIDTDQIIPARFLTTTTREGLGQHLFSEWRYQKDGSDNPDFALNQSANRGNSILVAGNNFGCGSSREHAPWALLDFGIRAVISTEIADIFRSNSLKNGLVPVIVDADTHQWLLDNPGAEVSISIETSSLTLPDDTSVSFPIDDFARYCLLQGIDQLGYLQQQQDAVTAFEEQRAWTP